MVMCFPLRSQNATQLIFVYKRDVIRVEVYYIKQDISTLYRPCYHDFTFDKRLVVLNYVHQLSLWFTLHKC